jgi:alanyl-tRNA synthetase
MAASCNYIEAEKAPERGTRIRGVVDPARRRDHMQQHSGQHVLSAAFIRLFNMPTGLISHGRGSLLIDLDTPAI